MSTIEVNPSSGGGGGDITPNAFWTAKGDIAVATGPGVAIPLPVGANGLVLKANSGQASGVEWGAVAGTGDVVGPASSVNNELVLFDGVTGKAIKSATGSGVPVLASGVATISATVPVANGGTNSAAALNNNRIMRSTTGAIVEAAAITASRALVSDANGIPTHATTTTTEINFVNGVTSAIQTQIDGKQTLDATLTALAAYNTNGLLTQTAADTFTGRTVTGTADRVTVTNGDGVAGNPTLDIAAGYVGQASIVTVGTITTGTWNGTDVAVTAGGTGSSTAAGAVTNLGLDNTRIASVGITIDGGGSAITTGVKGYIEVPYACTINQVTLLADQSGAVVVDIWNDTYANFPPTDADSITAAAPPTITASGVKSQDATLTGWDTAIAAGDILAFNVDSAATITRLNLILKVTKT